MKDLAGQSYWDALHEQHALGKEKMNSGLKERLKHWTRDYANEVLLRETLLPSFIPFGPLKTLEVGCAPGGNLLFFHERFGHDVYGVEYTSDGAEAVRMRFRQYGIDPEHIVTSDFFDKSFQDKYAHSFDFVFSEGFIEHFDNPENVVAAHAALVKPGGYLFILIPNLSGINRLLTSVFHSTALAAHNTTIMRKDRFRGLFPENKFEILFCDYLGMFTFGLFPTDNKIRYVFYRLFQYVQRVLNFLFRILFGKRPPESSYLSPYLVFIGKVK